VFWLRFIVPAAQSSSKQVRYEGKRLGLGLELISEMTVAYLWHPKILSSLPLLAETFGVSSPIVSL